jgi:hypothetical protein
MNYYEICSGAAIAVPIPNYHEVCSGAAIAVPIANYHEVRSGAAIAVPIPSPLPEVVGTTVLRGNILVETVV